MRHSDKAQPIDEDFAKLLGRSKRDVIESSPEPRIVQTGAAVVEQIPSPFEWPGGLAPSEAVIETFVVDPTGSATATSDNQPYVDAWHPLVEQLAAVILALLAEHSIGLIGDSYATASITPVQELAGTPHVDDDMYDPDDGVGVVAILGQWAGPRIATGAVPIGAVRPHGQLMFDQAVLDRFAQGQLAQHRTGADELVVFAQFGQLHAGPTAAEITAGRDFRQLIVFRAKTVPHS